MNNKKICIILKIIILNWIIFIQNFNSYILQVNTVYNFDGYPITWALYGKIHGDIFIDGGHGADTTPYSETFSLPKGNNIIWASVLIGVWGGNEYNSGWIELYLNNTMIKRQDLNGVNDVSTNVLISTHGCYLVIYNITNYLELNTTIELKVNTGGTSFDGRVYGIILIILYSVPNKAIKFCIGYGNIGFHYLVQGTYYNSFSFNFKDTYDPSKFIYSDIYVSYLASSSGENDYLYFNGILLDNNAGDESSGPYFDLDSYNVSDYLKPSNYIEFKRGDESYLHPILAVLKSTYKPGIEEGDDYIYYNIEEPEQKQSINWLIVEVIVVVGITIVVFSYQYFLKKKKRKEVSHNIIR